LAGCNFKNSIILGPSSFEQSNFERSNFESSKLINLRFENVNFERINCKSTDFHNSEFLIGSLKFTDLDQSNLKKAKFTRTVLDAADFRNSLGLEKEQLVNCLYKSYKPKVPIGIDMPPQEKTNL